MSAPEAFGLMPKPDSKSLVDYQPLFQILSPVHRLHHSLRKIETSGNSESYNRNHSEEEIKRKTAIVADNVLSKKISQFFSPQLPLLDAEQTPDPIKDSVQNMMNTDENEMDIQYLSRSAPCDNVN